MRVSSLLALCTALLSFSAIGQESTSDSSVGSQAPGPSLDSRSLRIRAIHIRIGDVFATDTPEENRWLFRLANTLHIETRESVVRRQLLLKEGDVYVDRLARESERILRRNRYFFDAVIAANEVDGAVELEVRTRDVWTFKPGINFSRSGGENTSGFELQESNLLGYGKEVTISHRSNVDRTTDEFRYFDPQLFGSHARLFLSQADNSDGKRSAATLDRPFYSLDTKWAVAAGATDWDRVDQRYRLGRVADEFRHRQESYQLSGGVSSGLKNGWVRRYSFGGGFARDRFESTGSSFSASVLPQDREFVYPFAGFTIFENKYEERRNEDQIERTEDLFSGRYFQATIGWSNGAFGADDDAAIVTFGMGDTLETDNRRHTLVLQSDANGRIEEGDLRNATLTGAARYYWRVADRQLLYASLSGSVTDKLDADRQLTLGGDSGLRGYPLRYQEGTAAALLTLEHRIYTKYYLFRIFHVGGAVFADAGRTWGRGPVSTQVDSNLGTLKDVGLGLRFGSSRSAFGNVIHVDLAFPLDGDQTIDNMQFIVETKASF